MSYVIVRGNFSVTHGKPTPLRVYVTGPHGPGRGVWSSTTEPDEAATFATKEAAATQARNTPSWRDVQIMDLAAVEPLA